MKNRVTEMNLIKLNMELLCLPSSLALQADDTDSSHD